ncbi:SIMPL domain-containing protein [Mycolicibacter engbaekii]|nr:SIMPL domain-containing protein [Mycolicibacter engbaekii]
MSTEISVRGSFSSFHAPERGTAHVTVAYQGPQMEPVYDRVARDLEAVKTSISPLRDNGSVTWWSANQLRTRSERPWNRDGKQLPLVHHAAVDLEVKFRDFAELSRWVSQGISNVEGFRLERVKWSLTDKLRAKLIVKARTYAVRDAVTRAQQYADALGLGKVRPLEVVDQDGQSYGGVAAPMRTGSANDGAEVVLEPNHIELSATVTARFVAHEVQ